MRSNSDLSRRHFVTAVSAGLAGWTIVPRRAVAGGQQTPPSERLNIACIGVGGRGGSNLRGVAPDNNIVALCDVDENRAGRAFQEHPDAKRYRDFRRMLDEMDKTIDAVVVSTPDHTHAVACMAAMERGKHLYCEKPLAHSVHEVRTLMQAAHKHHVVTQLGNQGHSSGSIRTFCEWIWDGAIGQVHTIHAGCAANNSALNQLSRLGEQHEVPATLDWDLWLGPALYRPYHPVYLPGSWRKWMPFGNGTVGDWVCHVVDPVFWALDLGAPVTIQADVGDYDPRTQGDTFPAGERITYQFPAKGDRGPVTMHWYSGTRRIPRPEMLEPEREPPKTGALVLGDKGAIMYGSHGAGGVRIIPEAKMREYKRPEETLARVPGHHQDWLEAIRSGTKAGSDFSYGGPLTEIAMLGIIAIRHPGVKLQWDTQQMRFANCPEANSLVNPPYRDGWTL
jgi:predicted dehydrogenase